MRLLLFKDLVGILALSTILSEISWWFLFFNYQLQRFSRSEISQSLNLIREPSIGSVILNYVVVPLITYLPFWLVVLLIIRIFMNLEKKRRRSSTSPIYQQSI